MCVQLVVHSVEGCIGVLGCRTEHQADAKAQLTVKTERVRAPAEFEADEVTSLETAGSENNVLELAEGSASQTDILEEIRLTDGAGM